MNRRTLLKLGLGGLVLGSLGFVLRSPNQAFRDYAQHVIDDHLKNGELIAGGVEQFAQDIQHAPHITYRSKALAYVLGRFSSAAHALPFSDVIEDFRGELDRQIISDYLLSSDFFFENKGPGATVNYIGYANRICNQANPFARFLDG